MILYAEFNEKGHHIKAYIPTSGAEPRQFVVKAYKKGDLVKQINVKMDYAPIFGVDISDKKRLEDRTEELLKSLP